MTPRDVVQRLLSVHSDDPGLYRAKRATLSRLVPLMHLTLVVDAWVLTSVLFDAAPRSWELPCMEADDLRKACTLIERYQDQDIGVADASLVVLARRYKTERLLTLDHRHFRVVRAHSGRPFTLLPEPR